MRTYHVQFYRTLLSSDGHPFKCLQGEIDVPDMENSERAVEDASRKFAALRRVRDWKVYADTIEVAAAN